MKLVWYFLALAAAAAAVTGDVLRQEEKLPDHFLNLQAEKTQLTNDVVKLRRIRSPQGPLARGFLSFMTNRAVAKHVAYTFQIPSGNPNQKVWQDQIKAFATQKARDAYRVQNVPIRDTLPSIYTIIELSKADRRTLQNDFENRGSNGGSFITDHEYKVHTFKKNGVDFDYDGSSDVKLELGVDSNGEVNHFAGTVKCRDEGRRHQRSVFRDTSGRLCMRTWRNPSPPPGISGSNGGSAGSSGTGGSSGSGGSIVRPTGARGRRPCPRGYRRFGRRCRRVRQRQRA